MSILSVYMIGTVWGFSLSECRFSVWVFSGQLMSGDCKAYKLRFS